MYLIKSRNVQIKQFLNGDITSGVLFYGKIQWATILLI